MAGILLVWPLVESVLCTLTIPSTVCLRIQFLDVRLNMR